MNNSLFRAVVMFSVALALGGCDDKKTGDTAPSGSAASEAKSGSGDMKATCENLCKKSVECAEELAKSVGAPEDAIKNAKAEAEKGRAECAKGCGDDVANPSDKDKADISKVESCLGKACGEFITCMDAIK